MPHLRKLLVPAALLWLPLVSAQPPDDPKKTEEPAELAEVRFTDDSVVRMSILQERVEITTKYGKLTIPIADIIKIDFGVHVPAELEKKITKAVEDLGSENYKTREMAVKDLVSWGPYAYPQVYRASKSDLAEVAKRGQLALEKIKAKHPARNLRLREEDVIVTASFTVVGKITTQSVKGRAENFGEVDMQLAKLRSIRWLGAASEAEVVVDAGKHGGVGQWMDTGYEVRQGARLFITANGTVNLWPQGGNGYISTPRGFDNQGGFGPKAPGTNHLPGALLGKIGDDGPVFQIGERYDGTMSREGKLYLHIGPSPWQNGGSVGEYKVKITPKSEFGGD
jgi:hypothetical protein